MKKLNRNLVYFISGRVISLAGSGMQAIALPLYILDCTGSGTWMGLFSMLSILPAILISPIAGVIGDQQNRKRIMVLADFLRACIIFFLAFAHLMSFMSIMLLFAGQILLSTFDSFFNTSSDGVLPELVSIDGLSKANALKGASDSLSLIIGPVMGGTIYGLYGIRAILFINAATFVISGFLEGRLSYDIVKNETVKLSAKVVIGEIKDTIGVIAHKHGLKQLVFFLAVTNFLTYPISYVIIPYELKQVIGFSSQQYGILQTFFMAGILIGNLIVGSFFLKVGTRKLMRIGILVQAAGMAATVIIMFPFVIQCLGGAGWTYYWVFGVVMALTGAFNPVVNIPVYTNLQKMVRNTMRSKFFSMINMISQLAVPAGSLLYGFLVDIMPVHLLVLGIGIVTLSAILIFLTTAPKESYEPAPETEIMDKESHSASTPDGALAE